MPRKKKIKIPSSAIKLLLIGFVLVVVIFISVKTLRNIAINSDYFKIKTIMIDPSLEFINARDLAYIKGQSIFTANLVSIQRKLSFKYPRVSHLKITRRFPDQIWIVAKKRIPFAQTSLKNHIFTLDEKGVILSTTDGQTSDLPFVIGLTADNKKYSPGLPIKGVDINTGLHILREFNSNTNLSNYRVKQIDVGNLSKIGFLLNDSLNVILDRDDIQQKIKILGVLLTQGRINLDEVKYIDLRFKEPIIGKK